MAPKTQATAQPVAQKATSPANPSASQPPLADASSAAGGSSVNKKKQKRRQKQAARQAHADEPGQSPADADDATHLSNGLPNPLPPPSGSGDDNRNQHDRGGSRSHSHSGAEEGSYVYDPAYTAPDGAKSRGRNKKKSKPAEASVHDGRTYQGTSGHPVSENTLRSVSRNIKDGSIWDTNGPEERSRIKAFWLSLSEKERKDLVNIEKSHVLQKMKEQQKHSCSCTVCGRKRTAIEEELEVLYEALAEELHHFAACNQSPFSDDFPFRLKDPRIWADPTTDPSSDRLPPSLTAGPPPRRRIHEITDAHDEDVADDDPEDDDYVDEYDEDDDDGYISESDDIPPNIASDFFQFGNSLTVKDGILTVADDLLKNDGQKFIDMMEQLAERRMQREEDARHNTSHFHPAMSSQHRDLGHDGQPLDDDEYDEEEDEDYDDDYEDYDEEEDEDELDTMTEDQRMEEGRRMFQIFAARMFEQRVVTAYREKVAWERQQALIDEQEQDAVGTSEAKKSKNAEKKKRQRQAAKEAKAQKEAAKEEERQRREAAAREAEEKKREEQRLKQDEQRKKKDAERQVQEEKRRKREAEAMKKLEAERERQQEQERKQRELKAEEKKKREEAERKKREERDSKEQEEKERKEQEAKAAANAAAAAAAAEKEALERKKEEESALTNAAQADSTQTNRSVSDTQFRAIPPPTVVALPPNLKSRNSYESPSAKVATPALPKAPTPSRSKDTPSQRNSTPQTPERTPQTKSSTPQRSTTQQPVQPPGPPPARQQQRQNAPSLASQTSPSYSTVPQSVNSNIAPRGGSMSPTAINGYQAFQGQVPPPGMMPRMSSGHPMPSYQSHSVSQPIGTQPRASVQGVSHQQPQHPQQPRSRGSVHDVNSGAFTQQFATSGQSYPLQREMPPPPSGISHSRHPSNQFDGLTLDTQAVGSGAPPPIGRPAPIKRPSSVNKSNGRSQERPRSLTAKTDVDDLSNHLGSSALLDDTDEPLPTSAAEARRPSGAPGSMRSSSSMVGSPFDSMQSPFNSFSPVSRAPGDSWGRSTASHFGAPGMLPSNPGHAQNPGWGGLGMGNTTHSGAANPGGWHNSVATQSQGHSFNLPMHTRSTKGNPRAIIVRTFAVQAYKILASQSSGIENSGFFDLSDIVRHTVESGRQMYVEPGIQLSEIRSVLDTDGDSSNGGGKFHVRVTEMKMGQGGRTLVRWAPDHTNDSPYSDSGAFQQQQQQQQGPRPQPQHLSHQGPPPQGQFSIGGVSGGQRQGLGLGEVGSPAGEHLLPNLGGLGRL